jgi:hypothetical protein
VFPTEVDQHGQNVQHVEQSHPRARLSPSSSGRSMYETTRVHCGRCVNQCVNQRVHSLRIKRLPVRILSGAPSAYRIDNAFSSAVKLINVNQIVSALARRNRRGLVPANTLPIRRLAKVIRSSSSWRLLHSPWE